MQKWNFKFELGHEKIDAEHRIFLGLIVDFQEAAKQAASKERLQQILEQIAKYAEFHFTSEELIMTEHQYPEQREHEFLHNTLLEEVKNICNQFFLDECKHNEVSNFLINWFAFHVSQQDRKLVSFIGSQLKNLHPLEERPRLFHLA